MIVCFVLIPLLDARVAEEDFEGGLSFVAQAAAAADRVALDSFDLAAGSARLGGQVAVEGWPGEPAVTGRILAEALPLPPVRARSPDPLPAWVLRGWRAALRVEAAHLLAGFAPVLRGFTANVALESGVLRLDGIAGSLAGGGAVGGGVAIDATAEAPRVEVQAGFTGAGVSRPAAKLPFDVLSGTLDAQADVLASGHSPAALLATLSGTVQATVRDGELAGLDLPRAGAALAGADPAGVLAEIRAALAGGITPFERLHLPVALQRGVATLGGAQLTGPAGSVKLDGTVDLSSLSLDLRATVQPAPGPAGDAPGLALRVAGPAGSPRRTPELAALTRWLAGRSPSADDARDQ